MVGPRVVGLNIFFGAIFGMFYVRWFFFCFILVGMGIRGDLLTCEAKFGVLLWWARVFPMMLLL